MRKIHPENRENLCLGRRPRFSKPVLYHSANLPKIKAEKNGYCALSRLKVEVTVYLTTAWRKMKESNLRPGITESHALAGPHNFHSVNLPYKNIFQKNAGMTGLSRRDAYGRTCLVINDERDQRSSH